MSELETGLGSVVLALRDSRAWFSCNCSCSLLSFFLSVLFFQSFLFF